jgi:hypothetical protein
MPDMKDALQAAPIIAMFVILAFVLIKGLPAWERIRLAEIAVHKDELAVREAEAKAVSALSTTVGQLTGVFAKVDETTTELKLFLRAAMREHEAMKGEMRDLRSQVDTMQQGRAS